MSFSVDSADLALVFGLSLLLVTSAPKLLSNKDSSSRSFCFLISTRLSFSNNLRKHCIINYTLEIDKF